MSDDRLTDDGSEHLNALLGEIKKEFNDVYTRSAILNNKLHNFQDYSSESTMVLEKMLSFLADIYSLSYIQDKISSDLIRNHIDALRDDLLEKDAILSYHEPDSVFIDSDSMEPEMVLSSNRDDDSHVKKTVRFGLIFNKLDDSTTIKERLKVYEFDSSQEKSDTQIESTTDSDSESKSPFQKFNDSNESETSNQPIVEYDSRKVTDDNSATVKEKTFSFKYKLPRFAEKNITKQIENDYRELEDVDTLEPQTDLSGYDRIEYLKNKYSDTSEQTKYCKNPIPTKIETYGINLSPGLRIRSNSKDVLNLDRINSNQLLTLGLDSSEFIPILQFKINISSKLVTIIKEETSATLEIKFNGCSSDSIVIQPENDFFYNRYKLRLDNYGRYNSNIRYRKVSKEFMYVLNNREFPNFPNNYLYRNGEDLCIVEMKDSVDREIIDSKPYIVKDVQSKQYSCKEYVLHIVEKNPDGISKTGVINTLSNFTRFDIMRDRWSMNKQEQQLVEVTNKALDIFIKRALDDLESDGLIELFKNGKFRPVQNR